MPVDIYIVGPRPRSLSSAGGGRSPGGDHSGFACVRGELVGVGPGPWPRLCAGIGPRGEWEGKSRHRRLHHLRIVGTWAWGNLAVVGGTGGLTDCGTWGVPQKDLGVVVGAWAWVGGKDLGVRTTCHRIFYTGRTVARRVVRWAWKRTLIFGRLTRNYYGVGNVALRRRDYVGTGTWNIRDRSGFLLSLRKTKGTGQRVSRDIVTCWAWNRIFDGKVSFRGTYRVSWRFWPKHLLVICM